MKNISGTVDNVIEKQSAEGGRYHVLRIEGEGYFDWQGHASEAAVKEGDAVKLTVSDGEFPRIQKIECVENGNGSQAREDSTPPSTKDLLIVRMSCLRSAAELLSSVDGPAAKKEKKLMALAAEMAKWVTNGHDKEAA